MPIPDIETLKRPLLEIAADGNVHIVKEVRQQLAEKLKLTEEERTRLSDSGLGRPIFTLNVSWAAIRLAQSGLVARPEPGKIQITPEGIIALETRPPDDSPAENSTDFVLEKYLEEFIVSNFHGIFNGRFALYTDLEDPDVTGQQFVTKVGIIDILTREIATNALVIIELKKGRTADSTVGQTLRYMGWVDENLCKDGQAVKGIIVCKEADPKLSYALKMTRNVEVRYYHIDFQLSETG